MEKRARLRIGVFVLAFLGPVATLLASVPLTLWGCGAAGWVWVLWLCEAVVVAAWPLGIGLTGWDLFAPEGSPPPAAGSRAADPDNP